MYEHLLRKKLAAFIWYTKHMYEYESLSDLLHKSRFATYATVNEDGSPHNSPMFFIPSAKLDKIYMGTHPDSLHARNITRTGRAFAVIYGITPEGPKGIYFKIENFHEVASDLELAEALLAHNNARKKFAKGPIAIEYYKTPNPQRMYVGDIIEISKNGVERGTDGYLSKDTRHTLEASELIA